MKGILGLIEGGSRGSKGGKKADRTMSSNALAKTMMKNHEMPLRLSKKLLIFMTGPFAIQVSLLMA